MESEINELMNEMMMVEQQGGNVTEADLEQIIRDIKNKIRDNSEILKEKNNEFKEMQKSRQGMKEIFSKLT